MQTIARCALAAALVMVVTLPAVAQEKTTGKPGVVIADLVVVTATVEAIDYAKRTVTLKGPESHTRTAKVDQAVKNFDQVKQGDRVTAEYYEQIAIFVRTVQEEPSTGEASLVEVAPRGTKPGLADVDTVEVRAKVEAIDYQKRTVTLSVPQGNTVTLRVDEQVKKFDQVKAGDEVMVRYTEAAAVTVGKP